MKRQPNTPVFAACATFALFAAPARAQDAGVAPPADAAPALTVYVPGAPAPRSASDVTRGREVLQAAPHRSADELMFVVPGLFVTQHSGEGKAYQIFYRGFDAAHGQDLEVWAGGAPVNDVSNLHGQGYADLHFLPVEVVQSLRATPGTYDPRQGDFAVAGTLRFTLGYDKPGITAKASAGSFDTRRTFLAYRPKSADSATFGAVEVYQTNGFGPSRAASRASAVAQLTHALPLDTTLRVLASTYAGRFDSAGVLPLQDIESGAADRFATYDAAQGGASSRTQLVAELHHRDDDGASLSLSTYAVLRALRLRSNFTGHLVDENGDATQQLNDDLLAGVTGSYRMRVPLVSARDQIDAGLSARSDWIDQAQRRVATADNTVTAVEVDARVRAQNVAGYLDLALHPWSRLTVRGGVRVDALSYFVQDLGAKAAGQTRAAQGLHVGRKATVDLTLSPRVHALFGLGEGFRSPQARSLGDGENAPFTSVTSAEVGVRFTSDAASASLAGFRTALSDDLLFDQATGRNERTPASRRLGVSADAAWSPRAWLQGAGSATYTRATFAASDDQRHAGDLVPYAPQLVARLDVSAAPTVAVVRGRDVAVRVGAGTSYLARRPLPYGQTGHDVFLLDGSAGVHVGTLALTVEAFNVLGARWFDGEFLYPSRWHPDAAPSLVPQRHVTAGAPRTFIASLSLGL